MESLKKIDWVKWLIIVLGGWLIVYPYPYKILVSLLVIIPLVTLTIHGIIGRRPSITTLFIGLFDNNSSFSPVMHLSCSTFLLGVRIFEDYDPESLLVMIGVGLISMLIVGLLLLSTHKMAEANDDYAVLHYILLSILILFYSPTCMFAINCVYDNTEPHTYLVRVVDKSRTSSKPDSSYNLKVTSWIQNSESLSIEVAFEKYHKIEKGDLVNIQIRDGLFGVVWYSVDQ